MPHWRTLAKPSETLRAYDLVGKDGKPKDYTLEIAKVGPGKVFSPESNKTDPMPFVWFKGASKPLGVNATNAKLISSIVGSPDVTKWVGHRITLYQTMVKSKGGERVEGIRVRPQKPAGQGEALPDREPDHEMLERQADAAREPGEEG